MAENQLVDVPVYAKLNKAGRYYARKMDLPYYADETHVLGCMVLGSPSEEEGKMIADMNYFWYCTPEAVEKKKQAAEKRRQAEEERARQKEEEEKAREAAFGVTYVSLDGLSCERSLYPLKGFLAERFFEENGMSEILDEVLGEERAFLIKLSAAMIASMGLHLDYDGMYDFPMKLHMCEKMDREMTSRVWSSVTEEECQRIFRKWIDRNAPQSVIAQSVPVTVTLYHDDYSDRMTDSWFSSRIRTGTRYQQDALLYRDAGSLRLLAMEKISSGQMTAASLSGSREVRNVQQSRYPEMRDATLHFFQPGNTSRIDRAMKTGYPTVGWLRPSQYPEQKEMTKKLKELETLTPVSGWRIMRWEGSCNGVEGHWALGEELCQRKNLDQRVRNILKSYRTRVQAMSYYAALGDTLSWCFDIDRAPEDEGFDDPRFTVKNAPRASEKMRKDFGRFVCFSAEPLPPDEQLMWQAMQEEDAVWTCTSYMNHGETSDVADTFFDAMEGRNLPLFLTCSFREWILRHSVHRFDEHYHIAELFSDLGLFSCVVYRDGKTEMDPMKENVRTLLEEDYGATLSDVLEYVNKVSRQKRYFQKDEY